ncbi:hypothetical protein CO725_02540 [Vibrio parahaemolyticus]|uniref:hypothetical protein n=1 Tax=Vibrio parahaemolyticus TaxID=670 RepID=UPI000BE25FC9|nr:hypothetical protein [Vibrio parahaemolyticus]ATI44552.1 hypothetical protein CO725_02540 [Vibrio parahaemolyticus]
MSRLKSDIELENKYLKKEVEFYKKEIYLLNEMIENINAHKEREIQRGLRLETYFDKMDEYIDSCYDSIGGDITLLTSRIDALTNAYAQNMAKLITSVNTNCYVNNTPENLEFSKEQIIEANKYINDLSELMSIFSKSIGKLEKLEKDNKLNLDENEFDDLDLDDLDLEDDLDLDDELN